MVMRLYNTQEIFGSNPTWVPELPAAFAFERPVTVQNEASCGNRGGLYGALVLYT